MTYANTIYRQLGKRIKHLRMDNEITQETLAFEANLNRNYVGLIERGERHPSIETVNKIANVLKVPIYQLFKFK